jgi:hypothetical protein
MSSQAAPQNAEAYYGDEDNHGNYQYTSLKDIITTMELEALEDDSYLKHTKRSRMVQHAKQAIREVTRSAANDVLAVEISVPPSLVWTLPQDYVNWVMVSVVTRDDSNGSLRLAPLDVNYNINIATGYLQDHDWKLLFDDEGRVLTSDASNAYAEPYKKYLVPGCAGQPTIDTAKYSKNGEFTIDQRRGKILFSSDLSEKDVVIQYVSDGLQADLQEEEITVHKYLKQTIENWVYYACIERKRNVPANEKQRALLRYKTTLHQAKMALSDFDLLRISRAMRTKTMAL